MPRGTPLTPDQVRRLGEVFTSTGNVAQAARDVGVSYAAAWEAIHADGDDERRYLHARALAEGEADARASVAANVARIEKLLANHLDLPLAAGIPPELEPADVATLARAQGANLSVLARVRIAVSKELGKHAPEVLEVKVSPREELARRVAELAARRGAGGGSSDAQ
ncbi:MAG: hypothetical protein U0324_29215 [Polyangiales bacterium]